MAFHEVIFELITKSFTIGSVVKVHRFETTVVLTNGTLVS